MDPCTQLCHVSMSTGKDVTPDKLAAAFYQAGRRHANKKLISYLPSARPVQKADLRPALCQLRACPVCWPGWYKKPCARPAEGRSHPALGISAYLTTAFCQLLHASPAALYHLGRRHIMHD